MVRKVVEGLIDQKPLGVPYGAAIWLVFALALGKLTVRAVNRVIRNVLSPADPNYLKKIDWYTRAFGFLAGSGAAYGLERWKWLGTKLGDGKKGLVLGITAGMLDAMFQRSGLGYENRDFTNYLSEGSMDKLAGIIEKVTGRSLVGPSQLGALPEARSSALGPKEEEFIQAPDEVPKGFTPEEPVDPVQRAEEILAEKSKI